MNNKGVPSRPAKTPIRPALQAQKEAPKPASAAVKLSKGNGNVPNAPATKGLTFKMPKMKAAPAADRIQARLKKKSPWFASIQDPMHGAGCKIPDETGVETGTLQIVQRGEVLVNSVGLAGA